MSSSYDHTIKLWDLNKGYCINTIIFPSNCNALSFSPDEETIFSGHVDGHLRLWDIKSGKLLNEIAAHSLAVTAVCLSRNSNRILTSGRDNVHNLFDIRSLEVCGRLGASGNRVSSNWSRSCISPDDNYVAAGSAIFFGINSHFGVIGWFVYCTNVYGLYICYFPVVTNFDFYFLFNPVWTFVCHCSYVGFKNSIHEC